METSSTKRFSNRVADYVRYRPGYPSAVSIVLDDACGPGSQSVVTNYQPMLERLREIFDRHQKDDQVRFLYKTKLYVGRFGRK